MTTFCIQCSMRAIVNDETPPTFDETPEQHQQRVHPDLAATNRERQELVRQFEKKMEEEERNGND